MRVVGSGALNLDLFYEVEDLKAIDPRLEPGRELWGSREELWTLRERLEKRGRFLTSSGGGSAANTIYALSSWGFKTAFIGVVGEDEEGAQVMAELKGVDLSRVKRKGHTACSLIILDAQRDRAIFVSPGSHEKQISALVPAQTSREEWLHLSSLISEEGFAFHLQLKKQHQGPFSLDPGEIYAQKGLKKLYPLLSRADLLFITRQELEMLGGDLPFLRQKVKRICLKRGAQGAIIYDDQPFEISPVSATSIVDNTGAGDVFDAGVIAGLLSGLTLKAAGELAASLAALSLRDYGRRGYPSREEFIQRRNQYDNT